MATKRRAARIDPPPRVLVMGQTWRVTNSARAWAEASADEKNPGPGITSPLEHWVALRPGLPLPAEQRILVHELVHVGLEMGGWLEEAVAVGLVEEAVACSLERPLLSIVVDNPALVAYLRF